MIVAVITELGLNVVATVCDQGTTNRVAIKALTQKYTDDKPSPYHFVPNEAQKQFLSLYLKIQ